MNRFLADENVPIPSYRLVFESGVDIVHVGLLAPSIADTDVMELARQQERILVTFDRDHGELVFAKDTPPPRGIVYFRLRRYSKEEPGRKLLALIESETDFDGFLIVVSSSGVRRRSLWLRS